MEIAESIARIQDEIEAALARRQRASGSARVLAATKTVGAERIREAYAAGLRLFGENRVQEREAKLGAVGDLEGAEWHLLGPLQRNKAARAVECFDVIESLDSPGLTERVGRLAEARARVMRVLIEVNIGREVQKHGVMPEAALELAEAVGHLPRLELCGVMAVPPQAEAAEASRRYFAALAELGERMRQALRRPVEGWEISMGMSHDYRVAVEEGATLVRLGTAIFGTRG